MTPAFETLAGVFADATGRGIDLRGGGYWGADVTSTSVPEDDVEGLLHEFCHWAMSGERRHHFNYGLTTRRTWRDLCEERMCGWVEDWLYKSAGVRRPKSSVDDEGYRRYPHLRRIGIGLVGSAVLGVGVIMLVTPGPAFVVIPMGLGILALEFDWARRWLHRVKEYVRNAMPKHEAREHPER